MTSLIELIYSILFYSGIMYVVTQIFGSISQYFTFTDCLFFGAIISATDPSKKKN